MAKKIRDIIIYILVFGFIGYALGSLAYVLISGYLFGSLLTKTLGIAIVWAIVLMYVKVIPFKKTNSVKVLVAIVLVVLTYFLYTYPFGNGTLNEWNEANHIKGVIQFYGHTSL